MSGSAATSAAPAIAPITELHSTAAVGREIDRGRRLNEIRRRRAIMAGAAQDRSDIGIHRGGQIIILASLRSLELEILVLGGQRVDLVRGQEVEDRTGAGVLRIDDVAGVAAHGILEIGEAGGHVVVHAINRALSSAAAIADLVADGAQTAVDTIETIVDGVVQGVGGIADDVGDAAKAALKVVELEAPIYVSLSGRTATAVAAIAKVAIAEQARDNDQAKQTFPSTAAKHAALVAAFILSREITSQEIIFCH